MGMAKKLRSFLSKGDLQEGDLGLEVAGRNFGIAEKGMHAIQNEDGCCAQENNVFGPHSLQFNWVKCTLHVGDLVWNRLLPAGYVFIPGLRHAIRNNTWFY